MADFIGKVDIKVYFGTKFDNFNIPANTNLIRTTATKTLTLTGNALWQTTYVTLAQVNVDDYQDIVGAQYVEIIDVGTTNHGSHWHTVLGYQNVSKKTAYIGIEYDAILSIGIMHITAISGILRRWTVDNDSPGRYTQTSEPFDQRQPFQYSYYRMNSHYDAGATGAFQRFVGFPYLMDVQPEVVEYINEDGTPSNVKYPKLKSLESTLPTNFGSSVAGGSFFSDGMMYYIWSSNSAAMKNYDLAVGLGHEVTVNAYRMPLTDLVSVTESSNGRVSTMSSSTHEYTSNLSITNGGYNNRKTGEVGVFFSLYNEVSGDGVMCKGSEIFGNSGNVRVEVSVNPYVNGCFYARIMGIYGDNAGYSGLVKSCQWPDIGISSNYGRGALRSQIETTIALDRTELTAKQQDRSLTTEMENFDRTQRYGVIGDLLSGIGGAFLGQPAAVTNSVGNLISRGVNVTNTMATFNAASATISENRAQQRSALNTIGTLNANAPPAFKTAQSPNTEGSAFSFVLCKMSPGASDLAQFDRFLTAYGYNVIAEDLNSPAQLQCRARFTFVMADDVVITALRDGEPITRTNDPATIAQIKQRFAGGLRIWQVEPDYDWSIANPII